MASNSSRQLCSKCNKGLAIAICVGCNQWLCRKHFNEHRSELESEMECLAQELNVVQQGINTNCDENARSLFSRIDRWEAESIEKIKEAANRTRLDLQKYVDQTKSDIATNLQSLGKEWQMSREKDEFSEIELKNWSEQLEKLRQRGEKLLSVELLDKGNNDEQKLSMIRLRQIEVNERRSDYGLLPSRPPMSRLTVTPRFPGLHSKIRWKQNGITVAGGHSKGNEWNQLNFPYAFDIDVNGCLYVTDVENNRVVLWEPGAQVGQLVTSCQRPLAILFDHRTRTLIIGEKDARKVIRYSLENRRRESILITDIDCRGLALDDDQCLYASSRKDDEVRRYRPGETVGTVVAGGHGRGNGLHQFSCPSRLFVGKDQTIYVVDCENHRIMKWTKGAKEGVVVAGGRGQGNGLEQLSYPRGVFVDREETVYVTDTDNDRIVRWVKGANVGQVILGGNGKGAAAHQFDMPMGLTIDGQGNLYVADAGNARIQKFELD